MNQKSKFRGVLAALALVIGLETLSGIGLGSRALAQQGEVGEVTFQIGQASIERAGKGVPVIRGAKIQVAMYLKLPKAAICISVLLTARW